MEHAGDDNVITAVVTTKYTKEGEGREGLFCKKRCFVFFACFVPFVVIGCFSGPAEPQPIVAVTRVVGSWSGRGTRTVGDVPSETGRFRIVWQTSNEASPGAGRFKLTLRSAISGRTIGVVADTTGVGSGTAEYDEGPRTYDFLVESASVDWTFRVEETSGEYGKSKPQPR